MRSLLSVHVNLDSFAHCALRTSFLDWNDIYKIYSFISLIFYVFVSVVCKMCESNKSKLKLLECKYFRSYISTSVFMIDPAQLHATFYSNRFTILYLLLPTHRSHILVTWEFTRTMNENYYYLFYGSDFAGTTLWNTYSRTLSNIGLFIVQKRSVNQKVWSIVSWIDEIYWFYPTLLAVLILRDAYILVAVKICCRTLSNVALLRN
jgi:hypothetical protein